MINWHVKDRKKKKAIEKKVMAERALVKSVK
jgi:hypothetical protein